AAAALTVCVLQAAHQLSRDYFLSAREPRAVVPRTALPADEHQRSTVFLQTVPSVVSIHARKNGEFSGREGAGSGFVWDPAGHIVTNDHVAGDAEEIAVVLDDGRSITAKVVGRAAGADLAVLRLDATPGDLRPIPIGRSDDLAVGQTVL